MNLCDIIVNHNLAVFDHFPISASLLLPLVSDDIHLEAGGDRLLRSFVDWEKLDRKVYMNNAEDTLMNIDICDRLGCTVDHRNNLDECYNLIIRSLSVASEEFVFVRSDEFTPVTGWNTHCKEKYTAARDAMIQ